MPKAVVATSNLRVLLILQNSFSTASHMSVAETAVKTSTQYKLDTKVKVTERFRTQGPKAVASQAKQGRY